MKRIAILLATGLMLVGGSVVRAEEEQGIKPESLHQAPDPVAAAEPSCAAPCCTAGCAKHSGRLCDWLLYRPMRSHCACCCVVSPCTPPVYTWFLDHCQAAGCRGGCGYTAAVRGPAGAGNAGGSPAGTLPDAMPER